jgi:hypothetical protein
MKPNLSFYFLEIIIFQKKKLEAIDSNVRSSRSPLMCVLSLEVQYCVQFDIEALGGSLLKVLG